MPQVNEHFKALKHLTHDEGAFIKKYQELSEAEQQLVIKAVDNEHRCTLLHWACIGNESDSAAEVVSFLLEQNIDYKAKSEQHRTALHYACRYGLDKHVAILLQKHAAELINLIDDELNTALHLAIKYHHKNVIKLLLQYEMDFNVVNDKGKTAIELAIMLGDAQTIQTVIDVLPEQKREQLFNDLLIDERKTKIFDILLQLVVAKCNAHAVQVLLKIAKNHEENFAKALQGLSALTLKSEPRDKKEVYLFVGAGNLSFELSFAKKHPRLTKFMIVTTYESEKQFNRGDGAIRRKQELQALGVMIRHDIDARKLTRYKFLKDKRPKRIYFSHPWAGIYPRGEDTIPVLKAFFREAEILQREGDKILIARKKNDSRNRRNYYRGVYGFHSDVFTRGFKISYRLEDKHKFNDKKYPGYRHSTTSATGTSPFDNEGSAEYVFTKIDRFKGYGSDFDEDSDSDTETSRLEANFFMEKRNKHGQTLLHLAVKRGDLSVIEVLLQNGAIVDAIDSSGRSALFYTIEYEEVDLARKVAALLLQYRADINFTETVSRTTPLLFALERKKSGMVKFFLGNRANLLIASYGNYYSFEGEIKRNPHAFLEIMRAFFVELRPWLPDKNISKSVDRKNNLETVNQDKQNEQILELCKAIVVGKIEVVTEKLQSEIDINIPNKYGKTAIFYVSRIKDQGLAIKITDLLLRHGANIDFVEAKNGLTPLLYVITEGKRLSINHKGLIRHFIMCGADFTIISKDKRIAFVNEVKSNPRSILIAFHEYRESLNRQLVEAAKTTETSSSQTSSSTSYISPVFNSRYSMFGAGKYQAEPICLPGLRRSSITHGGGNLYYAVAQILEMSVMSLKQHLATLIAAQPEKYQNIVPLLPEKTIHDYIADIKGPNSWAQDMNANALMQALNRPIVVITVNGISNADEVANHKSKLDPIFVYYDTAANQYTTLTINPNANGEEVMSHLQLSR